MPGKLIPVQSIGGHSGIFGLQPDTGDIDFESKGWRGRGARLLVQKAMQFGWEELGIWCPWGQVNDSVRNCIDSDTYGKTCDYPIGDRDGLKDWINDLNSDANCVPILYLPPLPDVGEHSIYSYMELCYQCYFPIIFLGRDVRYKVCVDAVGSIGNPAKTGVYQTNKWFQMAFMYELKRRYGVELGCEPPGEWGTVWDELCEFSWVTSSYLESAEKAAARGTNWISEKWMINMTGTPRKRILVQVTPEQEKHVPRWLAAGFDILKPVYQW